MTMLAAINYIQAAVLPGPTLPIIQIVIGVGKPLQKLNEESSYLTRAIGNQIKARLKGQPDISNTFVF